MIQETFLPRLFFRKTKTLSPIVGALSTMTVIKSGMGLLNPVKLVPEKYLRTQRGSVELVQAVTGGGTFSNAERLWKIGEERHEGNKDRDNGYKTKLKVLVSDLKGTYKRLLIRSKSKGTWLSICGTIVSGTVLYATEFRYFLCARYNVYPLNLQSHFNGCGTAFGVTHALSCVIDVLVILCHSEIRDKLLYLS